VGKPCQLGALPWGSVLALTEEHIMPNHINLRTMMLTLTVGISIAGAISACHSRSVAKTNVSTRTVSETVFGSNGLMDPELTPPFDETPITPRETVGATAEKD